MSFSGPRDQPSLPSLSITAGVMPAVAEVAWLGEGDFCRCYLLNTTHVVRYAKHAAASAALQREWCLLPWLAPRLPVAVPQPISFGYQSDTDLAVLIYPLVSGTALEVDVLSSLGAVQQAVVVDQLAAVLQQLHGLPLSVARDCGLAEHNPLVELDQTMQRARSVLWPHLPAPTSRYHEELWVQLSTTPALCSYTPALLHGDLSPDHVLTDGTRLSGVIDWGDAMIGDPAWDLIYIAEDGGRAMLDAVAARYAPETNALLVRKVQLYQQLNNVAYALGTLAADDPAEVRAALDMLTEQAQAEPTEE